MVDGPKTKEEKLKNSKAYTLIEVLIVLAIIGIVISIFIAGFGGFSIADGDRVGVITKFSKKGIKWDTWEGQMILGGQGTVTTNIWDFSVLDPEVVVMVKEALDSQKLVKLSYHQNFFPRPWNGSTAYFVNKVTPVVKQE